MKFLLNLKKLLIIIFLLIPLKQVNADSSAANSTVNLQTVLTTLKIQTPKMQTLEIKQEVKCCRVCIKGKACGNSCISSKSYTCRKPPGCACNGY
jgi:hypothetical protein